jgi:type IV secretion system protein VirD4
MEGVMDPVILLCASVLAALFGAKHHAEKKRQERVKSAYTWQSRKTQATADFATSKDLESAGYFRRKGLRIGRSPDGKRPLYYGGVGHLLVVAGARSGKLLTILVTLILALGSGFSFLSGHNPALLLVDPKAEMTCIVNRTRRRHGRMFVWNPYRIWLDYQRGLVQARINPMADIDPNSITVESDCKKLVDTFWTESEVKNDPHWGPSGKSLFAGIILTLVKYGKPEEKNLPTARAVLTGANGPSVFEFARYVMTLPDPNLQQFFARYAAPGAEESKELSGIISTAITQTDFLGDKAIAASLMDADVSFRQMKRERGLTISLCMPVNRLGDNKCFSMLSGWWLHCALEEGQRGGNIPCVAVIDEMSQITCGTKAWLDAFSLGAGAAGVQIVAVYQSISQVIDQFGSMVWQTVVQCCGACLFFGARDNATRKIVSELAGVKEVKTTNRSVTIDHRTREPHVNDGFASAVRPVIREDEVGALGPDEMILFCDRVKGPVKAKRMPYTKEFPGQYGPNPYFRKRNFWSLLFE